MEKVETVLNGRRCYVPIEHLNKLHEKEKTVKMAFVYQELVAAGQTEYEAYLQKLMRKIRNLNRKIPPCVEFIEEL